MKRMKLRNIGFAVLTIIIAFAIVVSCENAIVTNFLPSRNPAASDIAGRSDESYTIVLDISDDETDDTVTVSPDTGKEGDTVTLSYTVANTAHYNLLDFGGVTASIASVDSAGSGTSIYIINAEDASGGVITITAVFEHTNLVPNHIEFTDNEGHITKTYGDIFTNAVASGYMGSGEITYHSSDTTVAEVDNFGQVTFHKVGSAIITAEKAADAVFAHAQATYTLTVNPKPVTIIGLSADDKFIDGTTAATVIKSAAVIDGLIEGDEVTIVEGTAEFEDESIGDDKTVTFSGWSLGGADAGNYILSAQPASVTASISDLLIDQIAFTDTEGHITKTYGDLAFTNAITDAHKGSGAITYSSSDTTVATVDGSGKVTILKAGSAVITAEKEADAVYAHSHASYTLTVDKKPVTITGLSAANKVYDGTTAATVTGTATISGLVGGDAVTVSAGTAVFANKTVGTGKTVTFSGYSLGGADAGNYTLSAQPASVTANITTKPVTITGLSASNKVYDGGTNATVTGTAVISGLVGGDVVTVNAGTAVFASKTVGTGKTVTFSGYSLGGADAGNYTLSAQPAGVTANITTKSVTITGLSAANKQYDGSTAATVTGTAVISGLVGGDSVTVSAGTASFANASVGNGKTVTFSGWSLTGADAGNYTLSAQPASVTANISHIPVDMVPITAGTFIMGSPASEPNRYSDETQHSVTLTRSYYMGKYQVTQAQYQAVMGTDEDRTTTTYGKGNNYPIYYVNWYDAIVFCNKLSVMEGLSPVYSIGGSTDPAVWIANNGGSIPTSSNATWNSAVMDTSKNGYRLPTEAEWEYACRGSYTNKATETNTKPFGIGDGTKITGSMANFDGKYPYDLANSGHYNDTGGTYLGRTTTVGSYAANNYGLFDMHGNLYEWCWDWYKADITADNTNPTGAVTGTGRVLRGGYWLNFGQILRSACRINSNYPDYRNDGVGFRLVRS